MSIAECCGFSCGKSCAFCRKDDGVFAHKRPQFGAKKPGISAFVRKKECGRVLLPDFRFRGREGNKSGRFVAVMGKNGYLCRYERIEKLDQEKKNMLCEKFGDYCLDVSKLVFGGVSWISIRHGSLLSGLSLWL